MLCGAKSEGPKCILLESTYTYLKNVAQMFYMVRTCATNCNRTVLFCFVANTCNKTTSSLQACDLLKCCFTAVLLHMTSRAPEAVWQVWRPPYQSKIWYGDAIPIKSKAANLFIICNKSRIKRSAFYMFLSHEF